MFQRRLLLMAACLLLVAAFGSSQAKANGYDTWSGACTLTVKITEVDSTTPGNQKFVTQTKTKSGTVEMYIGVNGPTPNQEGYYLKFIESGVTRIGIDEMVTIRTDVTKSKTDKVLAIGAGSFFDDSLNPVGLVNLDASGTLKKDNTGQPTSLSLTMKLASGADNNGPYVWNCAPKVTLTKSPI